MEFPISLIKRKLFWAVIMYVGLLIWSGVYRYNRPEPALPPDRKAILVNAIEGDTALERKIRFTYKDYERNEQEKLPVVMVHGSPGSAGAFDGLAKLLNGRRIVSVDLPGFGTSEMDIPDYSIDAHAKYLAELMDQLEIEKAHFVGFSLGGGVIMHLYENEPGKVESVSFVASIGVQEYELLGDFYANRIVHAGQLALFWGLKELTPHFGIFDGMAYSYARNFYDTDQRPLRRILQKIDKPFQIIHGKQDPLVPVEAAREHARIVPQSEYHELDDDHFFVFLRPELIDEKLKDFWNSVESGTAKTRAAADPKRIEQSKLPMENKILRAIGPTAFVFFLLLVFVVFLNEDFAFVLGGILAAQGRFGLLFAIVACVFGSWLSVIVLTLLGRKFVKAQPEGMVQSFVRGRYFGFRFIEYFRAGRGQDRYWKRVVGFLGSALVTCIALTSLAFFVSKWLAEFRMIDPNETLSMLIVLPLFILPGFLYHLYQRWYAG